MSPTMNSRSSPGPITRLRLGSPPRSVASSVRAVSAICAASCSRVPVGSPPGEAIGCSLRCWWLPEPVSTRKPGPAQSAACADTRAMTEAAASKTCLVTGATGYIGGRLVPELLAAGHRVRVMTRSPDRLRDHPWAGRVEIVRADAGDPEGVAGACAGVDVAYYLVHALGGGPSFEETDRRTAEIMARAAKEA